MSVNARQLFMRLVRAMGESDFATLEEIVHPDFVGDFPQSGERIRGFAAFRAQIEHYPGGAPPPSDLPDTQIIGDEERWAITPNYTVVPLASPGVYTIVQAAEYPDGSRWHVLTIVELRDGRLYRSEIYFAPEIDPPLLGTIGSGQPG